MINTRLVAVAVLCIAALGGWFYVSNLRSNLKDCKEKVATLTEDNKKLKNQVLEVTIARDQQQEAVAHATGRIRAIEADLQRARQRVRIVEVPAKCDDALQWLVDEVTRD